MKEKPPQSLKSQCLLKCTLNLTTAAIRDSERSFQDGDNTKEIGIARTFFSGGVAGAASVFGNTPLDVVKTRMQV